MCTTTHFRSRNCGHHWLQIRQPCWPGQGFNTCLVFGDGVARDPSDTITASAPCPGCLEETARGAPGGLYYYAYAYAYAYDRNQVRMICDIKDRWRWGLGPSKQDPGVECAVM
ncbi:hypothetical protein AAE478_000792 [Parahypoxylon ruwenzoriense]